jgi:hypothetical protein
MYPAQANISSKTYDNFPCRDIVATNKDVTFDAL